MSAAGASGYKEKHKRRGSSSGSSSRRLRLPPNVSSVALQNVIALQNSGEIAESERELDSALKQLPKSAEPRLGISGSLLFLWRSRTRKLLGRAPDEVLRDLKSAVAHVEEMEATPVHSPTSSPTATPATLGATVTVSSLPPLVTGVAATGAIADGESHAAQRSSSPDRRTLEARSIVTDLRPTPQTFIGFKVSGIERVSCPLLLSPAWLSPCIRPSSRPPTPFAGRPRPTDRSPSPIAHSHLTRISIRALAPIRHSPTPQENAFAASLLSEMAIELEASGELAAALELYQTARKRQPGHLIACANVARLLPRVSEDLIAAMDAHLQVTEPRWLLSGSPRSAHEGWGFLVLAGGAAGSGGAPSGAREDDCRG